ncbi:MAG: TonB-dependent receptor [Acidobacteria bacterium]|nr:TonB-dependent receptor [Acidobacteriota bacterium]
MRWPNLLMLSMLFLFAATAPAFAQTSSATISGTVMDSTGAVVPGAEVTVKNVDTGTTRVLTTNERGRYVAPQLLSGNYEVSASSAGFQTEIHRGITIAVGREAVVDFSLRVGAVTETVEVTGEAPLVETTTSTTSGLVAEETVRELPLNSRNFTDLMDLSPNVKRLAAARGDSPVMGFGTHFSVAGAHPSQNKYVIDGINTGDGRQNTPGSAAGNVLGTEAIREFRVLTSNYSAEHGEVSGGIMTAVTKSGTNTLHGTVFEYLRNSALDARDFFDRDPENPSVRSDPPPFKRNQFGFSLGGPIVKDRSFYFGNYEGLRERLGTTSFLRVPTEAARRGFLPTGPCAAGCAVGPNAQKVLNLYPLPNATNHGDGTADFISAPSKRTREDYFAARLDHTFSEKYFMYGRYTFNDSDVYNPTDAGLMFRADGNRYQSLTMSFTSLLTQTVLNTFRAGVNRNVTFQQTQLEPDAPDASFLVFIPQNGNVPGSLGITGLGGLTDQNERLFWWTAYQFNNDLSYTRGNHSFKAGASVQRNHDNGNARFNFRGNWSFASIADFYAEKTQQLLTVLPGVDAGRGFRTWWTGAYVQDDWKVTPRLTLNVGLRFEWFTIPTEVNGKIATLRDLYTSTDTTVGDPFFKQEAAFAHFSPRVGLAWDPFGDGKTAIRAGVGIFQELIRNFDFHLAGNRMPPFYVTTVMRNTAATPLTYPDIFSNFTRLGIPSVLPRLDTLAFELKQPYKLNWSFNIQREFLPNTLFNIGYSGSHGVNLMNLWSDANSPPSIVGANGRRYIPQRTPRLNPNFTQIRYRHTGNDSYYNAMLVSVTKRLSQGFHVNSSYTWSKSIDTSSLKLSQGPEFGNADQEAWPHDPIANRGLSSWDMRHYWSTNFGYELPFGPGRALGGDLTGFAGKLLEGWSLSGILTATSGPPFSATLAFDYANALPQGGGGGQKPDAVGQNLNPVIDGYRDDPDHYFDANAFALPPITPDCAAPATCTRRVFGNLGRNTLTGPGLLTFDLNLMKNTKLTERAQLQFRAEFFNLFNRANFDLPNTTVFLAGSNRDATAGRITATATKSRQIQFALRFIF